MNIIIRADASVIIGTGHIMRCITLADELSNNGARVSFISSDSEGNMNDLLTSKGYRVHKLFHNQEFEQETDAQFTISVLKSELMPIDLLIVDHYKIDRFWEETLSPYVKRIMVIDDLANREHQCDYLLDQNYYENLLHRYDQLVPENCKLFLGPKYSLLRPEFTNSDKPLRVNDGTIKRVLISFGGSDPTNETMKVLRSITQMGIEGIQFDVIVGRSNLLKDEIDQYCKRYPYFHYYHQVDNIAEFMVKADLMIGAGGTSTWERCYLGLPSLVISVANNQELLSITLNRLGAIKYIGPSESVREEDILKAFTNLCIHPEELKLMSERSLGLLENHNVYFNHMLSDILSPKGYQE